MEVERGQSFRIQLKNLFLKESRPFTDKRDLNWDAIKKCGGIGVTVAVLTLLALPTAKPEKTAFIEQVGKDGLLKPVEDDPAQDALAQVYRSRGTVNVPSSLDHLYQRPVPLGAGSGTSKRETPMVLARDGLDSRTQIPPGSRIAVRLYEQAVVASASVPVIGLVARDFVYQDGVAIPEGSKVYGDVSFNDATERASVSWRMLELPDGRRRQIAAIGIGLDGQVGIEGNVRSQAFKNSLGETITRFIGAYAQGAMEQGAMAASAGGAENGLKNAISETAKARADAWGEDLRKEKKWIELNAGAESFLVLTQSFAFRDPGGTYGNR